MKKVYTSKDGPYVARVGSRLVKKPTSSVYGIQLVEPAWVHTVLGVTSAEPGDWLMYDTVRQHIFVVRNSYVPLHYIDYQTPKVRRFRLEYGADLPGGETGVFAYGAQFWDGTVVLYLWTTPPLSEKYACLADMLTTYGNNGSTKVIFDDPAEQV